MKTYVGFNNETEVGIAKIFHSEKLACHIDHRLEKLPKF